MKLILVSSVMILLAVSQVIANPVDVCPETEEVVWALGVECVVFRNECYFDRAASVHIPRKCSKTKTNELEYHDITIYRNYPCIISTENRQQGGVPEVLQCLLFISLRSRFRDLQWRGHIFQ